MLATVTEIKSNEENIKISSIKILKTDTKKQSDLPWWLQPEVVPDEDEEKKVDSMEESLQKKSDIPLAPVTLNFVGIRPSKLHLKNNQVSTISLNATTNISYVTIKFPPLTLANTIDTFKQLLLKEFNIPSTHESLLIYYGDKKLSQDEDILSDYGITNNSIFILAIYDNITTNHKDLLYSIDNEPTEDEISRQHRKQMRIQRDMDAVKRRLQRIQDLRNGIKTNATEQKMNIIPIKEVMTLKKTLNKYKNIEIVKGLDIILQEDINCMKLPICEHLLCSDSLYSYTLSQLINKEKEIKCPHTVNKDNKLCNQIWDYPLIKQCLLSNTNNKNDFNFNKLELLSARNNIELNYDLQKCPKCETLLYRNSKDNNFICKIECPLCNGIDESIFCWGCNEKWSDEHKCDTSFKASIMEILASCSTKKVGPSKKCPSIRACPKCFQLINHVSACKHMKCKSCKTNFCFICLKMMVNGQWKCGDYSDSCPTHKRQNYSLLPKLNQTSFAVF